MKKEKLQLKISKSGDDQDISEDQLKQINEEICDIEAEEHFNKLSDNVKHLVDDTENLNAIKMWKLRKKVCPKKIEPPVAKKNEKGEIITEVSRLKDLYKSTYQKRLQHRSIKPKLIEMYNLKMYLFNLRLEVTKQVKSESWSEEDLLKVLKSLKREKCPDSHGLIYELFRPEIIGNDLLQSLLMFCNEVKAQMTIPKFLTYTDITSFYKSRGEKMILKMIVVCFLYLKSGQ